MIVYGDPQYAVTARFFSNSLRSRLQRTRADSLEDLRTLLVQAGQFEQALADSQSLAEFVKTSVLDTSQELTDLAATAFHSTWLAPNAVCQILDRIAEKLRTLELPEDLQLNVKTPEGFEFYALYPDQFCAAARNWAAEREPVRQAALVVGLRSIGTTLSAVVTSTLRALGWNVRRITLRPTGSPWHREVALPRLDIDRFPHAIVTDEGPGISGSSIAATVEALRRSGMQDISVFPGHAGAPGQAATPEICDCWNSTRRYFKPLNELTWHRQSLQESLAVQTAKLTGNSEPFREFDDLSGGAWRAFAYCSRSDWPVVATGFERLKFRCSNQSQAVLWKFVGLGSFNGHDTYARAAWNRISHLAEKGFTLPPLGMFNGFLALRWINGIRLTAADGDATTLRRIGRYLLASARPRLAPALARNALGCLSEMAHTNTSKALGEVFAERIPAEPSPAFESEIPFAYGDGHMAPHEWVCTDDGSILKTDCEGHDSDHTVIGPQNLLWDVAAVMLEWNLNFDRATPMLEELRAARLRIPFAALRFHLVAYAAFRVGLLTMTPEPPDDLRATEQFRAAKEFYLNRLKFWITNKEIARDPTPITVNRS